MDGQSFSPSVLPCKLSVHGSEQENRLRNKDTKDHDTFHPDILKEPRPNFTRTLASEPVTCFFFLFYYCAVVQICSSGHKGCVLVTPAVTVGKKMMCLLCDE